jgi:hypothetical protein
MNIDKNSELSQGEEKTAVASEESRLEARRDFLKKAGKFALYTPPIVSLLMYPSMQAIAKSGGGGYGGRAGGGNRGGGRPSRRGLGNRVGRLRARLAKVRAR